VYNLIKTETLQYIVEIARCNSITIAAENLYVSQPVLSMAVKKLEDELGFFIFKRIYRGVEVTPEGEEVVKISKEILEKLMQIEYLHKRNKLNLTSITFIANQGLLDYFFPAIIDDISKRNLFEGVLLDFAICAKKNITTEIVKDKTKIGFCWMTKDSYQKYLENLPEKIRCKVLTISPTCIIMSSKNKLISKNKFSAKNICKLPIVLTDNDSIPFEILTMLSEKYGCIDNIRYFSGTNIITSVLKNQDYVTLGPKMTNFLHNVSEERLFSMPLDEYMPLLLCLFYSEEVEGIDYMVNYLGNMFAWSDEK